MKKTPNNRRNFLKACGLSTASVLLPSSGLGMPSWTTLQKFKTPVNFIYDGLMLSPEAYLEKLNEIQTETPIEPDYYGIGGTTKALETEFTKITGKEKAIYLPTGTMANQLAIKLLNGNNTKVMVPENSHVFRDEADAAQSVHNKRLVPVGLGKSYFDLEDLQQTISYTQENEVFQSGLGTVVIENPVRRASGRAVPLEPIKELSSYCKANGYKMHLDGARIHLAAAHHGVSVAEYASHFDTVYISLYKYLNAAGGAMLCGDASIIDQVGHQIKILGGTVFQSWGNTAMASHYLKGIEARWTEVVQRSKTLISKLNAINGLTISSLENGTNIHELRLDRSIDLKKLAGYLYEQHNIWVGRADEEGVVKFTVNESLLTRDTELIVSAWGKAVEQART